jgi:hypothetical protein
MSWCLHSGGFDPLQLQVRSPATKYTNVPTFFWVGNARANLSASLAKEVTTMRSQQWKSEPNTRAAHEDSAEYFGLVVSVVARMESCSLIRYRDREFIVDTGDLRASLRAERAVA